MNCTCSLCFEFLSFYHNDGEFVQTFLFKQLQDTCSPPPSFSPWRGGRGRESDKLVLVKCLRNRGKEGRLK